MRYFNGMFSFYYVNRRSLYISDCVQHGTDTLGPDVILERSTDRIEICRIILAYIILYVYIFI